jgi:FixJ family two-component response regulator
MTTPKPIVAVLDDEPEMRKALRRLLIGLGFCVEEFADGKDFLAAVDSRPLDCLLLDLHMAEVSGFDVLEAFRSRKIRVPVIVITAHDEPGTEQQVRALGACAYLKKPVDRDALLAAIKTVIASSHITPAAADATSSGGGGVGDDTKAHL